MISFGLFIKSRNTKTDIGIGKTDIDRKKWTLIGKMDIDSSFQGKVLNHILKHCEVFTNRMIFGQYDVIRRVRLKPIEICKEI